MEDWFERLAAPARRTLEGIGVRGLADLSNHTYSEIAALHGIGKNALRSIRDELAGRGLAFGDEVASPEVDGYIATFDAPVRERLAEMRSIIRARIPKAKERMSYGMATYTYGENIAFFGGYKNHIGFSPTPSGITAFAEELREFVFSKGGIQFPLTKELPKSLIEKMVDFRMREVLDGR